MIDFYHSSCLFSGNYQFTTRLKRKIKHLKNKGGVS